MLMDVITSPRGSARCGKEWSCRAESIFALKGINLKIVHSEAVHCYMGYFETYILPIIFFMYGGILSLTFSHLYHYWHFPTMVGFCHGGNVLGNHHHHHHYHHHGYLAQERTSAEPLESSEICSSLTSSLTLDSEEEERWDCFCIRYAKYPVSHTQSNKISPGAKEVAQEGISKVDSKPGCEPSEPPDQVRPATNVSVTSYNALGGYEVSGLDWYI